MPRIALGDISLYYEWRGNPDGPVVVFVNGLLTDISSWEGHLPAFVDRYRCLIYDCRGQGQSDKPEQVYATPLHTADLAALLDALAVPRAHIVGLSNGGAAALGYAALHPDRVSALVVSGAYAWVSAILRAKLGSWVAAMEAGGSPLRFDVATPWVWGAEFLETHYEALLPYREKGVNLPIAPVANLVRGAMEHDVRAILPGVTAPTLVVVGEDDVLTPPKLARGIAESVAHGELRVLPDLGHAAALEDVPGFCQVGREFFARVEAAGAQEEDA